MPTKVLNSYLQPHIKKHLSLQIGDFYFFKDFVVVEYAEDVHVCLNVLQEIISRSKIYYANNKPFGLIVNKFYRYTTVPSDANKLEHELPNLIATAVVTWDDALAINFDLENHFFKTMKRRLFPNMKSAEHWIVEKIKVA